MLKLVEPVAFPQDKQKNKNLNRCLFVLEQAEKQIVSLTTEGDNYLKICRALATLGESGRDIFLRFCALDPVTDVTRDKVSAGIDFDRELVDAKYKTPAKLFEIAEDYGLKTKPPVNLRQAKQRVTAHDFIGDHADEWLQYGIWEEDGIYWGADKVRFDKYEITNFTMKFLFFMKKSKDSSFRLITLKNVHGLCATIFVNTDEMISVGSFKKILEREGSFLFKGSDADLSRIKDRLQRDEKRTALITQLGWNASPGFYAFANGIFDQAENKFIPVDEYGTVDFNTREKDGTLILKNYFIPANAKMYEEMEWAYTSDKKFVCRPLTFSFEDWSRQFSLVYGKQGQMIMVFYFMALFSDIIFKHTMKRFPIFSVYGLPFTGKGTMIESIMHLFGEPQDQVMLEGASTVVGTMRTFSQYSNAIVWLDEYTNSLQPKIIGSIKNLYDRKGYIRGKKDNTFETEISPILSGCIMSGQEMPTVNPALFSRVILTIKVGTSFTDQQRENYRMLEKMQDAGISGITTMLLQYRPLFEGNFRTVYETAMKSLVKAVNNNQVGNRLLSNYSVMIATAVLISEKVKLPFELEDFKTVCKNNLIEQFLIQKGSDDIGKFWDIIESLFNSGAIKENDHFKLANGYLYLRVQDVYQLYATAMTERKDPTGLEKETLKKYLESDPKKFVANTRTWIAGTQHRVMQFIYPELEINLIRAETKEELRTIRKAMKVNEPLDEDDDDKDFFNL